MKWDDVLAGRATPGLFRWVGIADRDIEAEAAAAGWTVWSLDTGGVRTVDDFYGEVRAAWGLPPWFGDNLDALFDALRELGDAPTVLVWDGSLAVAQVGPALADDVLEVLRDTIAEAAAFAVILRGEPMASDAVPLS